MNYLQEEQTRSEHLFWRDRSILSVSVSKRSVVRTKLAKYAARRNILVVDDSATVRKLISGKLEKSGLPSPAPRWSARPRTLAEMVPAIVLLDITMPRMDGYEFVASTSEIRTQGRSCRDDLG